MAEGKNSFVLYSDQKELWDEISIEQAGKLIKHIFKYVNDEKPEAPDQMTKLLFIPIKNALKRDLVKYQQKKEDKSTAGLIGNLKRWHIDLYDQYNASEITLEKALEIAESRRKSQSDNPVTEIAVTDTVTVSDTVTVNVNETKDIINNSEFSKITKTSPQWLESIAMKKKVSLDAIKLYIDQFEHHLIAHGEQKNSLKEFKSHFAYWINKQDLSGLSEVMVDRTNQGTKKIMGRTNQSFC